MCLFFKGVADEAHKVQTNPQALFVDYKNLFKNQYHLDVVDFLLLLYFMGWNVHRPAKKKRVKKFQLLPLSHNISIPNYIFRCPDS